MTGRDATDRDATGRAAPDRVARAGQVVRVVGVAVWLMALGLMALGLAALGFGLAGLFGNPRPTNPPNSVAWLAGGVLVHDLVVAPAVVAVGFVLSRLVGPPYRSVVQGALVVSAAVAAASLPLWLGYGGAPGNWTVNPLPYRRNLLLVLGAVWFVAVLVIGLRWRRARRGERSAGRPPARSPQPPGPR